MYKFSRIFSTAYQSVLVWVGWLEERVKRIHSFGEEAFTRSVVGSFEANCWKGVR